jgi:glycosyltransferase involved in cell wall biosynthesis
MTSPTTAPAVWFPTIRAGTGSDVFTLQLCQGLNARGIRAEITWLPHRAEYLPLTVVAPKPPPWANIVHVNTWLHRKFIPAHLPVVATMHLCVHDPALTLYKSRAQKLYHKFLVKPTEARVLGRASRVVAVSRYTAARTQEAFGLRDVHVIYNGVPLPADAAPARTAPHKPFRLLYVGNWSRRKGVDLLAPIMQSLGAGFELAYTSDAHGAHQGAALPANCINIGRLNHDQLLCAYCNADALLFPTRLEGFGLVVAEAMSVGLPTVATAGSSLPELVTDGETGLLFGQDSIAAAVVAVKRLATDIKLWQRLGVQAQRRAEDCFSLETMVRSYEAVYRELGDKRSLSGGLQLLPPTSDQC